MSSSATPWTVAHQAPVSMGFSRQEYWSGLPCSPPGELPNPGLQPESLTSLALAGGLFITNATWEAQKVMKGMGKKEKIKQQSLVRRWGRGTWLNRKVKVSFEMC